MADQQMSQDQFAAYIAQQIKTLHSQSRTLQSVALSGRDCTGKSTLAANVREQLSNLGLRVNLLSIDTFLIPRHLRAPKTSEFIDYFENAFDYDALVEILETIKGNTPSINSKGTVVKQKDVVLVEGVFLLRKELCQWWNLTVWIEIDTSVIMNRAIKRDKEYFGDEETVRRVYENRCLPAQDYHVQRDLPKQNADITAIFENEMWTVTTSQDIEN